MLSLSAGSRFPDAGRVLWTGTKNAFRARRPRQSASYTRNNTFFKERSVLWRRRFWTTLVSFPCLRKTYSFWDHPQLHTSGLKSTERQPDFWTGSKLGWFYSRLHFMFICYPLFLFFETIRPPPSSQHLRCRWRSGSIWENRPNNWTGDPLIVNFWNGFIIVFVFFVFFVAFTFCSYTLERRV